MALGDGLIALLAALGVNAVSGAVRHHRFAIQSVGGVVLLLFAARLFFTEPRINPEKGKSDEDASLGDFAWDIPQMFFLTITNPGAVLGLFAVFSGVGTFVELETHVDVVTMVAAIMGGSLVSWIALSHLISSIRHHLDLHKLRLINRAAGVLMFGFGLMLLGEVMQKGPALVPASAVGAPRPPSVRQAPAPPPPGNAARSSRMSRRSYRPAGQAAGSPCIRE